MTISKFTDISLNETHLYSTIINALIGEIIQFPKLLSDFQCNQLKLLLCSDTVTFDPSDPTYTDLSNVIGNSYGTDSATGNYKVPNLMIPENVSTSTSNFFFLCGSQTMGDVNDNTVYGNNKFNSNELPRHRHGISHVNKSDNMENCYTSQNTHIYINNSSIQSCITSNVNNSAPKQTAVSNREGDSLGIPVAQINLGNSTRVGSNTGHGNRNVIPEHNHTLTADDHSINDTNQITHNKTTTTISDFQAGSVQLGQFKGRYNLSYTSASPHSYHFKTNYIYYYIKY